MRSFDRQHTLATRSTRQFILQLLRTYITYLFVVSKWFIAVYIMATLSILLCEKYFVKEVALPDIIFRKYNTILQRGSWRIIHFSGMDFTPTLPSKHKIYFLSLSPTFFLPPYFIILFSCTSPSWDWKSINPQILFYLLLWNWITLH